MVHALAEIRRVLVADGIMLDLRPLAESWPIEISSRNGITTCGHLTDLPSGPDDDAAAERAVQEAEGRGWFALERKEEFAFSYYWDTPSEFKEYVETEWEDFEQLDEGVLRATQAAWAVAEAEARVCVRLRMLIARWRKR